MNIEKVIMETHANTTYVMLGFPAIPLWLTFLMLEKVKGHNIFYSLKMTFLKLCHENSFIAVLLVLELLICLSYYRMQNQRVVLTNQKIVVYRLTVFGSSLFETTKQEVPLTEIEKIYVRTGSDFFEKRLKCSTIVLQTKQGEEIRLDLMNKGREFVDEASYQVAMAQKATEKAPTLE